METAIQEHLTPERLVGDYYKYKAQRLHGGSLAASNWPTTLAHPCEAFAVYMRIVPPEQRRKLPEKLGMIFAEGDDQARAIKRDLLDMGYEVEGAEGQMTWGKYQISGRKDLTIRKIGFRHGIRAEVKSCAPYTYDSINSVADIRAHKWHFIQKWDKQVCLYMVLQSVDRYWMLLKNKSSGQIKIIQYTLGDEELAIAEAMLKKAEKVNGLVHIGKLPNADMKISTPDMCAECEFYPVCLPELNFGLAAMVLTDEKAVEMAKKTERLMELRPFAKEFDEIDEELKEEVKALLADGGEQVVYGDWLATIKRVQIKAVPEKVVPAKPASVQQRVSFTNVGTKTEEVKAA